MNVPKINDMILSVSLVNEIIDSTEINSIKDKIIKFSLKYSDNDRREILSYLNSCFLNILCNELSFRCNEAEEKALLGMKITKELNYKYNNNKEAFEKLVKDLPQSNYIDQANWRKDNKFWENKAFKIALKILQEIRKQNISKTDLAFKVGITEDYLHKILQGKENLTLYLICKFEKELNIELI